MGLDLLTQQHIDNHPVVIPGVPVFYIRDEGAVALHKLGMSAKEVYLLMQEKVTAIPMEAKEFCKHQAEEIERVNNGMAKQEGWDE